MWAKAWLEEDFKNQLEHNPAEAAREALGQWQDPLHEADELRLCELTQIDKRHGWPFSTMDPNELIAIFERRSPRRIATPSEWNFGNYKIKANLDRDLPTEVPRSKQREEPLKGTYVQRTTSEPPENVLAQWETQEPWESAAAQWDRIYAFIYYHLRTGRTEEEKQYYKDLFETNPRQALSEIAREIGIEFGENDCFFRIGDSPISNGLIDKGQIEDIRDTPNANGATYIARLSC
jgi:hypothetical protein